MEILSIDVGSELQTLCEAQLRGRWQVPAELVRLALRIGAEEVQIQHERKRFTIAWTGRPIRFETLENLKTALDASCESDDRQRAISSLEISGMEGLLWAAGLRGASIQVVFSDGDQQCSFHHRPRGRPVLVRGVGVKGPMGVEIRWRCVGLESRRAVKWLELATRFAPAKIVINGRRVAQGFPGGLYHAGFEEPLFCRIGLTRSGDAPVLWLLRDGVVSARASLPGYPPFEAAVELGGLVAPGASAADMRRAVTPFLGELVDRAVWMMVEVSTRLPDMGARDRERIEHVLLLAARRRLRAQEICRIPIVRSAADDRLRSVDEIREMARRRGGMLAVVDASEGSGALLVDPRATVVASSETRVLLAELADLQFQSPSRRIRRFSQHVAMGLRTLRERAGRFFRGLLMRRSALATDLGPGEEVLLDSIRRAVSPLTVELCRGRQAIGRTASGLVVARSNPVVEVGVDLVSADSNLLYPLMLALDLGEEPSGDLREAWLGSVGILDPDHVS